ncbi:hypothetical protein V6N13_137947 [Hibiscus sabdariffa]
MDFGFDRSIGISYALNAELWAIYDGLKLAWNNGFVTLQVRSDCSKISRETNMPTDSLAKQVSPDQFGILLYDQPSCRIIGLLSRDTDAPLTVKLEIANSCF